MLQNSWFFRFFVILLLLTSIPASASDLRREGNAYPSKIVTQSGIQSFTVNDGLARGVNKTKIFGKNRPTTLWSDKRRAECYEHSIRLMAQLPSLNHFENADETQNILNAIGLGADVLNNTAAALDAMQTNYVDGVSLSGKISNEISRALRTLNPKSVGGIKIPCTNLNYLGRAMSYVGYFGTVADFAVGAALQEALAGDLALGRLDLLENVIEERQRKGIDVDPALLIAIHRARTNIVRTEDYWSALMLEVTERKSELMKIGLETGIKMVKKDAVKLLTKYYSHHMAAKAAAAKASTVAGLWAFALIATYETIDALLDQHLKAQISVTSATMAFILQEEVDNEGSATKKQLRALQYQAEFSYYDQMVKVSSGLLSSFYDIFTEGQPYSDAKNYFEGMREKTYRRLLESAAEFRKNTSMEREPAAVEDSKNYHSSSVPSAYFILIPAGTFKMGSPASELGHQSNETQHLVTLTNDFYISETEVTNQQYAVMAQWAYDNGYCTTTSSSLQDNLDGSTKVLLDLDSEDCEISFSGGTFIVDYGKDNHPVIEVSWYGAVAFCDWLNLRENLSRAYNHFTWACNGHDPYNAEGYRLPTEAEWEYACRAGTQTPFNTGNCLAAGTEANYNGNNPYPYSGCPSGPYEGRTVPVGSYPANGFSLYDMHGNVWEWCNDWYGSYSGDETDPVGQKTGKWRVIRGGCWSLSAQYCRSALRSWHYPTYSFIGHGFRVCRGALAR